ncbi:hypothetical protein [Tsukamurella pseudospumae]|uniref:PknH-like extracellular domain-containing protein n=1 Tax=Tsukamurella pseudospumae TaxID=239498 RepID=A0A138AQ51_9ACTN|nr:hypothetical protein [Tsukamurella pseudospumae]KXP12568.1 hypothetical protein AXK60_04975 [Tsukamurella pseudospumae]
MIAKTTQTSIRTRFASATAIVATVAAGATLAAPAASAAPVNSALVLTQAQFPAGSTDYRAGRLRGGAINIRAGAPQPCVDAANRLNAATTTAQNAGAAARNGYSSMVSIVISPMQGGLWRSMAQACSGRVSELAVPGDLARYNPAVITYGGKTDSTIEGAADVNGHTVNVLVRGLSDTPANAAKFWQVFRAQIQKVQAAR